MNMYCFSFKKQWEKLLNVESSFKLDIFFYLLACWNSFLSNKFAKMKFISVYIYNIQKCECGHRKFASGLENLIVFFPQT